MDTGRSAVDAAGIGHHQRHEEAREDRGHEPLGPGRSRSGMRKNEPITRSNTITTGARGSPRTSLSTFIVPCILLSPGRASRTERAARTRARVVTFGPCGGAAMRSLSKCPAAMLADEEGTSAMTITPTDRATANFDPEVDTELPLLPVRSRGDRRRSRMPDMRVAHRLGCVDRGPPYLAAQGIGPTDPRRWEPLVLPHLGHEGFERGLIRDEIRR